MKHIKSQFDPSDLEELIKTKDFQNAQKELNDQESTKKNIPALHDLFLNEPALRPVLIDPLTIARIMTETQRQVRASSALSQQHAPQQEQLYQQIIQQIAPYIQADPLLAIMVPFAKQTKIKRVKKVIFWSIAELLSSVENKRNPSECITIRSVIAASIIFMSNINERVYEVTESKPPRDFSYEKVIDKSLSDEDWEEIIRVLYQEGPDFCFALSARALEVFEKIQKPFGLRFYQILHYPTAFQKKKKSNLIITPGQEQESSQEEEEDPEQWQRINQSIRYDLAVQDAREIARYILDEIKVAAFGEQKLEELKPALNASVLSFFLPVEYNPFVIRLYQESGEKAEEFNPEDEKNLIIEIKSSPEAPTPYRKYAEKLEEKGEVEAAFFAYNRTQELMEQEDEQLTNKIKELSDKLKEEAKQEESE